jgi:hypothetical protein
MMPPNNALQLTRDLTSGLAFLFGNAYTAFNPSP